MTEDQLIVWIFRRPYMW